MDPMAGAECHPHARPFANPGYQALKMPQPRIVCASASSTINDGAESPKTSGSTKNCCDIFRRRTEIFATKKVDNSKGVDALLGKGGLPAASSGHQGSDEGCEGLLVLD